MSKKVLFISGSIGLGHVLRDLAIAKALRQLRPDVEITWLADEPARSVIQKEGERIAPESSMVSYGTKRIEEAAKEFRTNMTMIGVDMMGDAMANAKACRQVIGREGIDLVVGDEVYDLLEAVQDQHGLLRKAKLIFITDFIGFEPMTENPMERLYVNIANSKWYKTMLDPQIAARILFVGVPEDIPNKDWPLFLPSFKDLVTRMDFLGYILSFDPRDLSDRTMVRTTQGYGDEPLIVCTVGGTSAGKPLLDLCAQAYLMIKRSLPRTRMVLVCGPRIDPQLIETQEGLTVVGYLPDLYRHLAACDLAITTASGTTSLELLALKKPFIYFPLEQHFEQSVHVSASNRRRGADLRLLFSQTTPEMLAKMVLENIGRKMDYEPIPLDGARKAAAIIDEVLGKS
jgi:UDP-N-acetylglucosamine:LPS N-acetylglucosamine transferase